MKRVLIIAGSDSGGGAGIQADIKTVSAHGCYAATAITAITAQNTLGVFGVHPVPIEMIKQQISLVLEDIGADAIKTGMLHSKEVIEAVAEALAPYSTIPLILDPVMVAKGGHPLLKNDAVETLIKTLLPRSTIITPNIPEAELLTGIIIKNTDDMKHVATILKNKGAKGVLIKGGHGEGKILSDFWMNDEMSFVFESERIETNNTHGTGCTLASAIASNIALNLPHTEAISAARKYVYKAIQTAPNIGKGHGPLNHLIAPEKAS